MCLSSVCEKCQYEGSKVIRWIANQNEVSQLSFKINLNGLEIS